VGDDTGAAIQSATVLAIPKTAALLQPPTIYRARADARGQYAMTVSAGQYSLCVHAVGLYLDPCLWGGVKTATVTPAASANVPLRLVKGAQFVLRAHDNKKLAPQAEALAGGRIAASVVTTAGATLRLPILYENERIRDYGAVLPLNTQFRVAVGSNHLTLVDNAGANVGPQGISFQMTAADFAPAPASPGPHPAGFGPRATDTKIIHVYTASLR
jgi:hypothetical protein